MQVLSLGENFGFWLSQFAQERDVGLKGGRLIYLAQSKDCMRQRFVQVSAWHQPE